MARHPLGRTVIILWATTWAGLAAAQTSANQPEIPLPDSAQPYEPPQAPTGPNFSPEPYAPLSQCLACPIGTSCQNGYCAPSANVPVVDPVVSEEERLFTRRLENRMQPRFTLDLEGALGLMGSGNTPAIAPTGIVFLGYRQNKSERFGLVIRAGLLLGDATFQASQSSASAGESRPTDRTAMAGVLVEVMPTFGPYGRFFFAPSGWLGYLGFSKHTLVSASETNVLDDGKVAGIGLHGGFVLGDREQTVLSFSTRLAPFNGLTMFQSIGIGFEL